MARKWKKRRRQNALPPTPPEQLQPPFTRSLIPTTAIAHGTHIPTDWYDRFVRDSGLWKLTAASLLRAARCVHRQVVIDHQADRCGGSPRVARLFNQVLFLLALSLENALKANIAHRLRGLPTSGSGTIPPELHTHDILNLARLVGLSAESDPEKDALLHGERIILVTGRYHLSVAHDDTPMGAAFSFGPAMQAYESLILRAVKMLAQAEIAGQSEYSPRNYVEAALSAFASESGHIG